MKTANLFSLSLFVALAGLMTSAGCSTPAVDDIDKNKAAASEGDDDDDDDDDDKTPAKKKTPAKDKSDVAPTNTPPGDDDDDTATPPAGGDEACGACFAKNAKAKKFDDCAIECNDQACADKCMETSGCSADQTCQSVVQECEKVCQGGAGTGDDDDAPAPGDDDDDAAGGDGGECLSCVGTGPAAKYIQCSDQCQDAQCDQQCFEQACGANQQACESKLDQCENQCFGGQP